MLTFDLHTADTAPEGADETLRKTAKSFGFVPNLYATLAESPAAVEAYSTLSNAFGKSGFSPAERQAVDAAAASDPAEADACRHEAEAWKATTHNLRAALRVVVLSDDDTADSSSSAK